MEMNFTAKSIEEAVDKAVSELGVDRTEFTYDVIEMPKSGFLGLGSKPAVIKVTYKAEIDAVKFVEDFLNGLMDKIGIIEYNLEVKEVEDKSIVAELNGAELASLIKKRSEIIDAIQSMTALAMNRHIDEYYKISVDVNNGKERNAARLENLAAKVAKQVQKTKRKVTLSSMPAANRRIIHSKLQNFENIITYSVGQDPNRRVVIAYKWPEGTEPPVEIERKPYNKNGGFKKPYGKKPYNKNGYKKPYNRERNFENSESEASLTEVSSEE